MNNGMIEKLLDSRQKLIEELNIPSPYLQRGGRRWLRCRRLLCHRAGCRPAYSRAVQTDA